MAGLLEPETEIRRTLAGVVVERRALKIRLYREAGRAGLPSVAATPGAVVRWDHRFEIEIAANVPGGLHIAALGAARPAGMVRPAGLRAAALATLPALFRGDRIVAVPSLGWFASDAPGCGIVVTEAVSRRLARPPRFPLLGDS